MGMVTAGPGTTLRALRAATTVARDDAASMAEAVRELIEAVVAANGIEPAGVLSAIFSATPDLRCRYPAAVARELGWGDVPMLCVQEMDVEGAPPRCVRLLLHLATDGEQPLRPVYLRGARVLRPDLAGRP